MTPAPPRSRKGNRVTALRWGWLLRDLGHHVSVIQEYTGQRYDLLVALHARRSARSIARFRTMRPHHPIVLALTGTDLYRDIHHSRAAQESLRIADRLVLLQPMGMRALPSEARAKARVIYQSVSKPAGGKKGREQAAQRAAFDACVLGHLRAVKDPFRTALAARRLPESSRIVVHHLGAALNEAMARRARREMRENRRYRWYGELPRHVALRRLGKSRLLVLTSKMEGGANVLSEAIALGVPVIASRIDGSVGLLGADYPGYFSVGDTRALARLMRRAETDERWYSTLRRQCTRLRPLFAPKRERQSWFKLLGELDGRAGYRHE